MKDFFGIDPSVPAAVIVFLAPLSLWVIALVDILRSRFRGHGKALWFLTVVLLPLVGFILYFHYGRKHKATG